MYTCGECGHKDKHIKSVGREEMEIILLNVEVGIFGRGLGSKLQSEFYKWIRGGMYPLFWTSDIETDICVDIYGYRHRASTLTICKTVASYLYVGIDTNHYRDIQLGEDILNKDKPLKLMKRLTLIDSLLECEPSYIFEQQNMGE